MKKTTKSRSKTFASQYERLIKSGRTYVGLVAILEDGDLRPAARILFHIISSLSYVEGYCFATNKTLGEHLGLQKTMVKQYLQELEAAQLIETQMITHSYGIRREIYIRFDTLRERYPISDNEKK